VLCASLLRHGRRLQATAFLIAIFLSLGTDIASSAPDSYQSSTNSTTQSNARSENVGRTGPATTSSAPPGIYGLRSSGAYMPLDRRSCERGISIPRAAIQSQADPAIASRPSSRNDGFAYNVIWSGPHAGPPVDSLAMIFRPKVVATSRLRVTFLTAETSSSCPPIASGSNSPPPWLQSRSAS